MNAMLIDAGGRLAKTVVPDPVRREGEVLIEVHAAAVRAELWQDGKKLADCLPVPVAEDLPLPEGGATAYSFQLPEIEVTMEANSWIGVVFIATDNLGRTSTNGEFFTIQDDMLLYTDDTDPIWEAIRAAQGSE